LVRQTFMPQVRSTYQGYVAWRGLVPETEIPQHVSELIANKFTVHQGEDWTGHILAYMIPGEDGGIAPGQRRLNWVWYENVEELKLPDLLTDVNGKVHGFSVPRGLMRNDLANRQRQVARAVLPPVLADMVEATQDIFLQAIHDLLSPSHVVHGNVAFLGDSGAILRPHTAAGTTKAAVNAWLLAKCLRSSNYNVEEALKVYGVGAQQIAENLVEVGVRLGTKSQFPESGNEGGMFDI
jgi:2-polyprenyl-6-methoxyphenol hydroxylase-like FAD-dependent oxidoreductase